jgi:E3 ubiquitin-protein ligase listerin
MAKQMPNIVGAWLCGLSDNDKLVVKAAATSFKAVFPSHEKQVGVWKAYQGQIVKYCSDAILSETITSLSDTRTVNKDDAEAKYARVLGAAISVLVEALGRSFPRNIKQLTSCR